MKNTSFLLLFVLLFSFGCQDRANQKGELLVTDSLLTEIDGYLNDIDFQGVVLIGEGNEIRHLKGYGFADREKEIANQAQTVFTVGSISKQFTATAILKLVESGRLGIDDPIGKYFADLPEDKKGITIHHLLTHSGGFPGAIGEDFQEINAEEFMLLAMEIDLLFKPGTKYEYSNVGYSILGILIEKISGKSYEQYLTENLFKPAGMKNSGYILPEWDPDQIAVGYKGNARWGKLNDKPWGPEGPYWHLKANGGIMSTAGDMFKWLVAMNEGKILADTLVQKLYKPYILEYDDGDSYYGYGWAVMKTMRGTRLIAHNGGNGIFFADCLRYLDDGVAIFLATNATNRGMGELAYHFGNMIFLPGYRPPQVKPDLTLTQIPDGPDGKAIASLFAAIESGKPSQLDQLIDDHFSKEYRERGDYENRKKIFATLHSEIGLPVLDMIKVFDDRWEVSLRPGEDGVVFLFTLMFDNNSLLDGIMIDAF